MKRFAYAVVATVLAIPLTGCDSGGGTGTNGSAGAAANTPDPHVPGEAAAYEAKVAKEHADKTAAAAAKANDAGAATKKH